MVFDAVDGIITFIVTSLLVPKLNLYFPLVVNSVSISRPCLPHHIFKKDQVVLQYESPICANLFT